MKIWQLRIDKSYMPKVSILVPTYNESNIIRFKLQNLNKVKYPKDLTQIIIVDSKSSDNTIDVVNDFVKRHPESNTKVLVESKRKGKSAALNFALKYCEGEIIIVSDADCFWPSDILQKALPFLADPDVGAVSGRKILLNSRDSWVTKTEDDHLNIMNIMRLGESKVCSTPFFEGGFSAYKKELLESFDPYNTGSDDCGTVIMMAEKKSKAILVREAKFFTTFPVTWRENINIKTRRANQLVRVFGKYFYLLLKGRIKSPKRVIINYVFLYLFSPVIFFVLLMTTVYLVWKFPYFASIFLVFLIPRVGSHLFEIVQNYLLLLLSIFSIALSKKFVVWSKPSNRALLTEDVLRQYRLI